MIKSYKKVNNQFHKNSQNNIKIVIIKFCQKLNIICIEKNKIIKMNGLLKNQMILRREHV